MKKTVLGVRSSPQGHWVGDGFPVKSLFSYDNLGRHLSPFLLLDYAAPVEFSPTQEARGVGEHPHRGFETVTIVYQGEVAHRDSAGNGGLIGPGDVQWMTAASGILHEEFHSPAFARRGGTLEMAQLWVNLPAKDKMAAPRYQTVLNAQIPMAHLPGEAGVLRVIAGQFGALQGPATTASELNVWDVRMRPGRHAQFDVPEGHTCAIALLRGKAIVNGMQKVAAAELVVLDRLGSEFDIAVPDDAKEDAVLLILSGVPFSEPIVGHGPFVMNSREEIDVAIRDFNAGKFGSLPAREAATTQTAEV